MTRSPKPGEKPFDRDSVLDAIDVWAKHMEAGIHFRGLCWYFGGHKGSSNCAFQVVPEILDSLDGVPKGYWSERRRVYYWPMTFKGQQQRAMMLAFMLTWADE